MDFTSLKEKAKKYSTQAKQKLDAWIDSSIKKIGESSFVISTQEDLQKIIESSKNATNSYWKISRKKVVIFYAEKDSDYYIHILSYIAPVLFAKAWTQQVKIKLTNIDITELKEYSITESPALLVFEDAKFTKVIYGKENIEKVVKTTDMDINNLINNL